MVYGGGGWQRHGARAGRNRDLFQQYQYPSIINYHNVPEESYLESDLQEAMESYGNNLSMADGESGRIVPRTLTKDDGIGSGTGSVVDQPSASIKR